MTNRATKWAEFRVGDLGQVFTGRTPSTKCPEYFGNEFFFITPGDMHQGKHVYATERSLSNSGANLLRRIQLPSKSICVSCIGWQMGEVVMTSATSFTNQQINSIVPNDEVDADFLYYSFLPRKQELLSLASAIGVRTPILNKSGFCDLRIVLPPLLNQRKIASILSAYDDLIENNMRRIKILKEMAQNLYREWFVKFRFPGYQHTRFTDSPLGRIPEGWETVPFSALANYVNGYAFKPDDWAKEGKPIIKIRELKAGIAADTPRNVGDGIPEKYKISDGDVLFSWSADLDVYLWRGGKGLLNQHLFNVVPFDGFTRTFCFYALKEAMPRFRALSLGSTMHHIKRSALDQVSLIVAAADLRKWFDSLVEPMHGQLLTLSKQLLNLRRTRDLLLPKLISGEVDVSELDITAPAEVVL